MKIPKSLLPKGMQKPIEPENWATPIVKQPTDNIAGIDRQRLVSACYDVILEIIGEKYQRFLPYLYNEAVGNLNNYTDEQLIQKINRIVEIFDVYRIDVKKLIK